MTKLEIIRSFLELAEATSPSNLDKVMELMGQEVKPSPPIAIYLTQRKLAALLGFNPATLYRWKVPHHDIGGCRRYILSEVQAYLAGPQIKNVISQLKQKRMLEHQESKQKKKVKVKNAKSVAATKQKAVRSRNKRIPRNG